MKIFSVIDGGDKPKAYRKRYKTEPEPLICVCGSATSVEVKTGRMIVDGKITGGVKQILCIDCKAILS